MNQITHEVLDDRIKDIEEIIEKSGKSNQVEIKQLIIKEATKLIQELAPKGISKEDLLKHLEDIFGSSNFANGKYKGGKDFVVETIKELLGKGNFQGNNFTGGWNEEQDTANINKVFGSLKKDVEDKLDTAKKGVDAKLVGVDAKLKEADSEIKSKLKAVDDKLIAADKEVKDKLKEVGSEVVKTVVAQLKDAKSEVSKELRDFLDKDNFYPVEWKEGDLFPKDRAGKWKNAKDLALMQAKYQAEIEDSKKWISFFMKHNIPETKYDAWKKDMNIGPDQAEMFYTTAKTKGKEVVDRDFDKTEELRIDTEAQTPKEIEEMWKVKIPQAVKEQAWNKFFKDREKDGRINKEWQRNWIDNENLSVELAVKIYAKGWNNSPDDLIGKDKMIVSFKTNEEVEGKPYPITTENVDPQLYSGFELKKVHQLIAKRIEAETDLDKFPDVKGNDLNQNPEELITIPEISNYYNQKEVPDTRSYKKIKELRDERIRKLFKEYFLGTKPDPVKDLTKEQLEAWRSANAGLKNNGKEQRQVFNNGWKDPSKISNGKWVEYEGVKNIDVLKYKPEQITTAIKSANQVLSKIKAFKSLRELEPKNFKDNQTIIDELKKTPQLLPVGTLDNIDKAINDAETNLLYHLEEPLDGGIKKDRLDEIEEDIRKNRWTPADYEPLTTDILNKFISSYPKNSIKVKGEKEYKNSQGKKVPFDSANINDWLKDKGAYEIKKDLTDKENALALELRGQELLGYFYDKAKFSPENLADRKSYCKTKLIKKKSFMKGDTISPIFEGLQGHLPIGTGVGKTTKTVNCLVGGGEKDEIRGGAGQRIILVMPNQILVEAAAKYHNGWLQDWGCVWHGKKINNVKCKLGTYTPATEEEIKKGEYIERDYIFKSHGKYKVVKNDLLTKEQKGLSIITGDNLIGFIAKDLLLSNVKYTPESTGEKDENKELIYRVKEDKLTNYDPISKWQPDDSPNNIGWFKTQTEIDTWRKDAESKVIDKENDIIMFDEGHFAIPAYQSLQKQVVNAGYRVIRMSATFEGQEFSITSTYPRSNLYAGWGGRDKLEPDAPSGDIKIDNPDQAQRLADLRKVDASTIKWKDEKGQFTPVSVNFEERLKIGKTWFFLPSLILTPQQQQILKDIGWMNYTPEWNEYVEAVSFGMPMGSLGLVNVDHGVGLSPDVDTAILGGKMAVKTLVERFQYKYIDEHNINQADAVQEIGRVARFMVGTAYLLSPKWEELDSDKDVAASMVDALFEGEVSHIYKKGYEMIQDPIMLRTALAVSYRFGKPPEEILIGLKVDDKTEALRVQNKQPLIKLEWRTRDEPQPDIKFAGLSFGKPDEGLWKRYLGDKQVVGMKKEVAKERLLENISTFIAEDANFPEKIEVFNQSNLIDFIWGDAVKADKEAVIFEVRKVLNGVIKKSIEKIKDNYDPVAKTSKKREVIEKVANYYNVADAFINISVQPKKGEESVSVLTLQIEKPKINRRFLI